MSVDAEPEGAMESEVVVKALRAARMGNAKAVKEALEKEEVTVDSFDAKGDTLLHAAASQGHKSIVKDLFRRGADPKALNFSGKTAYEVAHELNYWELGDYMREKVGLEKLGPPRWKGEPGGGALDDEALKELNERRERAQKLKLSLGKLAEVDFDVVLSAVSQADGEGPSKLTPELEAHLRENVERLRERLGDRPKLLKVESVLESLWNRFSVHRMSVLDDGSGKSRVTDKLDAELSALRDQMRGFDIEGLIGLVKKAESSAGETTERCDFLLKSLGEEKTMKENFERLLQESAKELEKAHKATREEQDTVEKARKEAADMREAVQGITNLHTHIVSPPELQRLVDKHSKDQRGISPDSLSPFLADLLKEADTKLEASRELIAKEREKVDELTGKVEEVAAQSFDREKELEAKIASLEVQLTEDDGKANSEAVKELEQRIASIREEYEAKLDAAMQSAKVSIAKAKEEMKEDVKKANVRASEEFQVDRGELEDALQTAKQKLAEVTAELHAVQSEHKASLAKLKESQNSAMAAREQVEKVKERLQSSSSITAIRAITTFRDNLGLHRKALNEMRSGVLKASLGVKANFAQIQKELAHFCRFILPLPNELPEEVRAASLTSAQLAAALTHMVPKYRLAVDKYREINNELQELKGGMRVHSRCGPLPAGDQLQVHFRGNDALSVLADQSGPREFEFDVVHAPGESQKAVYESTKGLLHTALEGSSVCVVAHGPSGSGKTHSVFGDVALESGERGLVLRFLQDVFRIVKERAVLTRIQVGLSILEIVNDHVTDVIAGQSQSVKVTSDRLGKVAIEGLSEHAIDSAARGAQVLRQCCEGAATRNGHRGHLLVTIYLRCKEKRVGGRSSSGRLTLADLASSDCSATSESDREGLRQVQSVHASLAALHDVLKSAAAGKEVSHSQFGSTSLTKILMDYVGTNGRCMLFVMLPMAKAAAKDALECLNFAKECVHASKHATAVVKIRKEGSNPQGGPGVVQTGEANQSKPDAPTAHAKQAEGGSAVDSTVRDEVRLLRAEQAAFEDFVKRLTKVVGVDGGADASKSSSDLDAVERKQQKLKGVLQAVRQELDAKDSSLRDKDNRIRTLEADNLELSSQLNVFPPGPAHNARKIQAYSPANSSAHLGSPSTLARNFGVIEDYPPPHQAYGDGGQESRRESQHMPHINGTDGRASIETSTRRSKEGSLKAKGDPRSASVPPMIAQIISREKKPRIGGQQLGSRHVLPGIGHR